MQQKTSLCLDCGTAFENSKRITWDTDSTAVRKKGDAPIFGYCDICKENQNRSLGTNCSSARAVYLHEESYLQSKR